MRIVTITIFIPSSTGKTNRQYRTATAYQTTAQPWREEQGAATVLCLLHEGTFSPTRTPVTNETPGRHPRPGPPLHCQVSGDVL